MSSTMQWQVSADGGYMYADELSDMLRTHLQPATKFRQFCEPDEGALEKGLHRGDKYRWNNHGNLATQGRRVAETQVVPETNFAVSQSELTVIELANSVPYTAKLTAMAKHDVIKIVTKTLKNDLRKNFDIEAWTQFNACKLRYAAATSTTSVVATENAATATTNNVALGSGYIH